MKNLETVYEAFIKRAKEAGYEREALVLGYGRQNGGIVLIGEAPGKDEVAKQRPFVGKAGKILDAFLQSTGIDRADLFITNTVKLRPYKVGQKGTISNRPPNAKELALCRDCLREELAVLRPRLVVTLGNTPLRSVLNDKSIKIGDCHGRPIACERFTLFALYHPASLIYRRELAADYEADLVALKNWLKIKSQ